MSASLGDRIAGLQLDPPLALAVATGVIAFALVAAEGAWRRGRNIITVAHEAGHAVAALVTGRRLVGVGAHPDRSGLALTAGRADGPGMVATVLAGYLGPSVLGLVGALVLADGLVTIALWVAVVLVPATLVLARGTRGVLLAVRAGAPIALLAWYAPAPVQATVGLVGCWFLLVGAIRPVVELGQRRRAGYAGDSDVDELTRLTPLAAQHWIGLLALGTTAALCLGGWLILR